LLTIVLPPLSFSVIFSPTLNFLQSEKLSINAEDNPDVPDHATAASLPLKSGLLFVASAVLAALENVEVFIFAIGKPLPYSSFVK